MRSKTETTSMHLTRRAFGAGLAAGTGFLAFALPVRALTVDQARQLVDKLIADIDQSKPVLLHCASGRRSTKAIAQMTGKVKFPQI